MFRAAMLLKITQWIGIILILSANPGNTAFFLENDGDIDLDAFMRELPEAGDNLMDISAPSKEQPRVAITHMLPLEANRSYDFSISAGVKNLPHGALMTAHYRLNPHSQFKTVPMKEATPNRYAVEIPSPVLDGEQIQYYIEASFAGARLATSGSFGNPHRVALINPEGKYRFALVVAFAIGGIWVYSRFGPKKAKKTKADKLISERRRHQPAASARRC